MTKWFWDGVVAIARVFVESGHPYIGGLLVGLALLIAGFGPAAGAVKLLWG